uniref:Uncharacterized protein n=1 Tax=Timema tahoe TaxID=61484 RepID=A0A7R9IH72_9NEOP|nr:unnamed protein product [Timema tahoe]
MSPPVVPRPQLITSYQVNRNPKAKDNDSHEGDHDTVHPNLQNTIERFLSDTCFMETIIFTQIWGGDLLRSKRSLFFAKHARNVGGQ